MIQCIERGLHAQRAQRLEDFDCDYLVHACAREGNATANHLLTSISSAPIAWQQAMLFAAGVTNLECPSTTTAAQ